MTLCLFDLDNTLLAGDSDYEWGQFLVDRGVLAREGDEIFLYDNVELVREPDAQRPAARMTTSFLHIIRDRSIMRTDREVKFVEGRRSLSGRGMEYNNDSRELVLHSDVQARFDPEKQ